MINLINITSRSEILELLIKEEMYKAVAGSEDIDVVDGNLDNAHWYRLNKDNETIGLMILIPMFSNCWSFHGGLYKAHRGINTSEILKECISKLREIYKCVFVTTILEQNIPAIKLVQKTGFVFKTTIVNASTRGNLMMFGEV